LPYKFISPIELCDFFQKEKNSFILDIRSDSAYNGISVDERQNAYGKINGSVNIPSKQLSTSYQSIPKDRPILIVNDFNGGAATAAAMLIQQGYKNVNVLFNGLDALVSLDQNNRTCVNKYWKQNNSYWLITPAEFDELAKKNSDLQIVDVRLADEFNNQSKTTWRNVGIIKNAINIPFSEMPNKLGQLDKNKPVLVYHFSGPDAFAAAKMLTDQGFKKVYVLNPGLFSLRWQAANLKGKSYLKDWVVNIPEENR
jgi:rhodanese-related sulfurtransferase